MGVLLLMDFIMKNKKRKTLKGGVPLPTRSFGVDLGAAK